MVNRENVILVASSLNITLSDKEVDWIIKEYPSWKKERSFDSWIEVVEEMLYSGTFKD